MEDLSAPVDLGSNLVLWTKIHVKTSMNVRSLAFAPKAAETAKEVMNVSVSMASSL